jgi:hypothetical protein
MPKQKMPKKEQPRKKNQHKHLVHDNIQRKLNPLVWKNFQSRWRKFCIFAALMSMQTRSTWFFPAFSAVLSEQTNTCLIRSVSGLFL